MQRIECPSNSNVPTLSTEQEYYKDEDQST